jgi:poly(hydroxyalkanoate) depolymerase family esterase
MDSIRQLPGDIVRGHGEALSIREMVEHAIATFTADRRKVFVTGLSAGGAMASVMLATYPEVFAGGAIIAGLPYGCASNVQQAFEAMFTEHGHTAQALGDRVRAASRHRGPWPKISVWHGTSDPIVKPFNGEDIIRQWTNVHGLSDRPSYQESTGSHTRRVWNDANREALIEAFTIRGMAHGVPLAATAGERVAALPVHFSWRWESPLRITSHASGACTNLLLQCRLPRRWCQDRFRFQLTTALL